MSRGGRWARFASRIAVRLLAVNALVLFLPVAALVYFDRYELRLLELQEQEMAQQGRLLAAALGRADALDPVEATATLARLDRQTTARLRVIDRAGAVVADSATFGPRELGPGEPDTELSPEARGRETRENFDAREPALPAGRRAVPTLAPRREGGSGSREGGSRQRGWR